MTLELTLKERGDIRTLRTGFLRLARRTLGLISQQSLRVALSVCACVGVLLMTSASAQQAARETTRDKPKGRAAAEVPRSSHLKTRSDEEITRQIRQTLLSNKKLSAAARKIQIITKAQYVTLKGQVRTPEEKSWVEGKAAEVAGDDYVMNELTVIKPVKTREASRTKTSTTTAR